MNNLANAIALKVPARRAHNRTLALRLAAAGIPVFPSNGKTPLIPRWQLLDTAIGAEDRAAALSEFRGKHGRDPAHIGCTKNAATIKNLWREFPDAVPSISCGPAGLLALDADQHKDGPAQLVKWEAENGGRPALAPVTQTRSGGLHIWFKNDSHDPLGNAAGAFASMGVDVRGAGGQCVAPGAIREDGARYASDERAPDLIAAFTAGTIPLLPAPVAKVLREAQSRSAVQSNVTSIDEAREIAKLRDTEWPSFEDVTDPFCSFIDLEALRAKDSEFADRWDNPTGDHSDDRFTIARCLQREYGAKMNVVDYAAILSVYDGAGTHDELSRGKGLYNCRDLAREFLKAKASRVSDASQLGAVNDDEPDGEQPKGRAVAKPLFVFADAAARDWRPVEYHIEGWIPKRSLGFLFGPSKALKSFGAIDMVSHLVNGVDWRGFRSERCGAIYWAGEGQEGISGRFKAWMKAHGYESNRVGISDVKLNLREAKADNTIRNIVKAYNAASEHKCGVFIIDTWRKAVALAKGDEFEIAPIIKRLEDLARELDITIICVGHTGKDVDRGMSGTNVFETDVSFRISVRKSGRDKKAQDASDATLFTVDKMKDGNDGVTLKLRRQVVDIGTNKHGAPVTSLVFEPSDVSPRIDLAVDEEAPDLGPAPNEGRMVDDPPPLNAAERQKQEAAKQAAELTRINSEPVRFATILEAAAQLHKEIGKFRKAQLVDRVTDMRGRQGFKPMAESSFDAVFALAQRQQRILWVEGKTNLATFRYEAEARETLP